MFSLICIYTYTLSDPWKQIVSVFVSHVAIRLKIEPCCSKFFLRKKPRVAARHVNVQFLWGWSTGNVITLEPGDGLFMSCEAQKH